MANLNPNNIDDRLLVLAPVGRDALLMREKLGTEELTIEGCVSMEELCGKMLTGAGAAFISEEALTSDTTRCLTEMLNKQPAWSDFPVIVLAINRPAKPAKMNMLAKLGEVANLTLVERPARIVTLASIIKSALRARRRQYEVRDHLIKHKQLEESLKQRAEELSEANRLKDEFLATISHELRTPLSAILGWSNLLRRKQLSIEAQERALETIERNGQAQAQLISDLLDVSRIITGKLRLEVRPINLTSIIGAAVDTLRPAAEAKAIDLDLEFDETGGQIKGDPNRLQQVIWNLLSNAIKFTPNGGRVKVSAVCNFSRAEIIIEDSGQGISPEFLPYVFDRFRQADSTSTRQHGGLGLGLAIVKHLVELHGGAVSVKSQGAGRGARFSIVLPLHSCVSENEPSISDHAARQTIPDSGNGYRLDGIRILLVDDIMDVRELFTTLLSEYGAEVLSASSAEEALNSMKQSQPDILISDIGMPVEDGYTLIRKVRAIEEGNGKHIPAVALTAYAGPQDRIRILSAGYQMHVTKPIDGPELATVITSLLNRNKDNKNGKNHRIEQ